MDPSDIEEDRTVAAPWRRKARVVPAGIAPIFPGDGVAHGRPEPPQGCGDERREGGKRGVVDDEDDYSDSAERQCDENTRAPPPPISGPSTASLSVSGDKLSDAGHVECPDTPFDCPSAGETAACEGEALTALHDIVKEIAVRNRLESVEDLERYVTQRAFVAEVRDMVLRRRAVRRLASGSESTTPSNSTSFAAAADIPLPLDFVSKGAQSSFSASISGSGAITTADGVMNGVPCLPESLPSPTQHRGSEMGACRLEHRAGSSGRLPRPLNTESLSHSDDDPSFLQLAAASQAARGPQERRQSSASVQHSNPQHVHARRPSMAKQAIELAMHQQQQSHTGRRRSSASRGFEPPLALARDAYDAFGDTTSSNEDENDDEYMSEEAVHCEKRDEAADGGTRKQQPRDIFATGADDYTQLHRTQSALCVQLGGFRAFASEGSPQQHHRRLRSPIQCTPSPKSHFRRSLTVTRLSTGHASAAHPESSVFTSPGKALHEFDDDDAGDNRAGVRDSAPPLPQDEPSECLSPLMSTVDGPEVNNMTVSISSRTPGSAFGNSLHHDEAGVVVPVLVERASVSQTPSQQRYYSSEDSDSTSGSSGSSSAGAGAHGGQRRQPHRDKKKLSVAFKLEADEEALRSDGSVGGCRGEDATRDLTETPEPKSRRKKISFADETAAVAVEGAKPQRSVSTRPSLSFSAARGNGDGIQGDPQTSRSSKNNSISFLIPTDCTATTHNAAIGLANANPTPGAHDQRSTSKAEEGCLVSAAGGSPVDALPLEVRSGTMGARLQSALLKRHASGGGGTGGFAASTFPAELGGYAAEGEKSRGYSECASHSGGESLRSSHVHRRSILFNSAMEDLATLGRLRDSTDAVLPSHHGASSSSWLQSDSSTDLHALEFRSRVEEVHFFETVKQHYQTEDQQRIQRRIRAMTPIGHWYANVSLLVILFNLFAVSARVGLGSANMSPSFVYFELALDIMCFFSNAVNFFIPFEEKGHVVTDFSSVARRYLRHPGRACFDALTTFPMVAAFILAGTPQSIFARANVLPRVFKFHFFFRQFQRQMPATIHPTVWRLVNYSIDITIVVTVIATFNLLVLRTAPIADGVRWLRLPFRDDPEVLAQLDASRLASADGFMELAGSQGALLYSWVWLQSLSMIGDKHAAYPQTDEQFYFSLCAVCLAVITLVILLSSVEEIVVDMVERSSVKERKVMDALAIMNKWELPVDLKEEVVTYYSRMYDICKSFDFNASADLLADLPEELRNDIEYECNARVIRSIPLFASVAHDQDFVRLLAGELHHCVILPGAPIVVKGEEGDCMFFLSIGDAAVLGGDVGDEVQCYLGAGSFFGETTMLFGGERPNTIVAVTLCVCYVVTDTQFEGIVDQYPEALEAILNTAVKALQHQQEREAASRHRDSEVSLDEDVTGLAVEVHAAPANSPSPRSLANPLSSRPTEPADEKMTHTPKHSVDEGQDAAARADLLQRFRRKSVMPQFLPVPMMFIEGTQSEDNNDANDGDRERRLRVEGLRERFRRKSLAPPSPSPARGAVGTTPSSATSSTGSTRAIEPRRSSKLASAVSVVNSDRLHELLGADGEAASHKSSLGNSPSGPTSARAAANRRKSRFYFPTALSPESAEKQGTSGAKVTPRATACELRSNEPSPEVAMQRKQQRRGQLAVAVPGSGIAVSPPSSFCHEGMQTPSLSGSSTMKKLLQASGAVTGEVSSHDAAASAASASSSTHQPRLLPQPGVEEVLVDDCLSVESTGDNDSGDDGECPDLTDRPAEQLHHFAESSAGMEQGQLSTRQDTAVFNKFPN